MITLAGTERLRKNCFTSLGQLEIFFCFLFSLVDELKFHLRAEKKKFSCESGTFFSVHSVFALFARLLLLFWRFSIHSFLHWREKVSDAKLDELSYFSIIIFHHNFRSLQSRNQTEVEVDLIPPQKSLNNSSSVNSSHHHLSFFSFPNAVDNERENLCPERNN